MGSQLTPVVFCSICEKQVDRLVYRHEQRDDVIIIKVWCHGDTDEMSLGMRELSMLGQSGIDEMLRKGGTAFTTKRLIGDPQ